MSYHTLAIYQHHNVPLYSYIQGFYIASLLDLGGCYIECVAMIYRPGKHEYIHGRRARTWKEQREVEEIYWKGDWPTLGGVMRIIGMYDAISAKAANLGVSSVKLSG